MSLNPGITCQARNAGVQRGALSRTLNHAAYSACRNSRVSTVATISPPMIATAIGPKNTLRESGIIASTAVIAVSTMGRNGRTVASRIACHGVLPRSAQHTSALQSLMRTSSAVFSYENNHSHQPPLINKHTDDVDV